MDERAGRGHAGKVGALDALAQVIAKYMEMLEELDLIHPVFLGAKLQPFLLEESEDLRLKTVETICNIFKDRAMYRKEVCPASLLLLGSLMAFPASFLPLLQPSPPTIFAVRTEPPTPLLGPV